MRLWFHLGAVGSLLFAFGQSPFGHFHLEDAEHGHGHGEVHLHWMHGASDGPEMEVEDSDGDAHWTDWLAGDGISAAKIIVDFDACGESTALAVLDVLKTAPTPQNHDPPWRAGLPARAPPA